MLMPMNFAQCITTFRYTESLVSAFSSFPSGLLMDRNKAPLAFVPCPKASRKFWTKAKEPVGSGASHAYHGQSAS